jgi:hypothetical protein
VHLRTTRAGTSIVIPNSYPNHVDRIAPAGDVDGDGHADASMRVLTDAAESSSGRFDERLVVLFGPVTSPRIYALRQGTQVRVLR